MNITSSYQVRIVNCSVNLIDTVRIYQEALSYLIGVVSENWDAVKSITTGALEQQRYIEKLVHGNKNREAKYQEFDKMFHKYPSYLRRATITAAIGAVSSYRSNLANWENTDKHALIATDTFAFIYQSALQGYQTCGSNTKRSLLRLLY